MLYCKNATQQNLALTLNPAMLYRGVVTSATNMAIITGVQFPLTGVISKIISGGYVHTSQSSIVEVFHSFSVRYEAFDIFSRH